MSGALRREVRYLAGIDGGNSKTLAVVADEDGEVLGIARSAGSNHQGVGVERAMEEIERAVRDAMRMAGVEGSLSAACFCLAGADLPEDFDLLRPALDRLGLAERIELDNDSLAILRSGTSRRNAVAVGWGSGNTAVGRNAAGEEIRLPALGWISGDWGGGGDLAEEAIRLVARAHDGRGDPTALSDLVFAALGVRDGEEMIRSLYFGQHGGDDGGGRHAILGIAPMVFEAAAAGDAVARGLVERSAEEIAVTALALLRRLKLLDVEADVVLGGSIFKATGSLLVDTVRGRLATAASRARIVLPDVEPVVGAFFGAMEVLGVPVDNGMRARARESYARECEEVVAR